MLPLQAQASLFHGETLDAVADAAAWVVLVIAPIVAIGVFWLVHIIPEKIAEKKHHPQTKAIQALCLLSLVFGGLLWPLALLWATSRPVLHKLAYGTDRESPLEPPREPPGPDQQGPPPLPVREELARLRAELERFNEDRPPSANEVLAMRGRLTTLEAAAGVPAIDVKE
ncbi:DUF3302 domain-containing protein [Caldimonas brevitalea]|uniref:DUF3302 domain-containing protein n=1 Tax=Caldimonas brevitalea TaxID=413882 RepID=A0A0G3BMX5_9BURK|nr:DUF3302 domain-containing protein [Caldimonas brevitalea]AKJ29318.1 hypothetical protein AAW51_2627 [Caldimonas brevitalea]